MGIIIDEGIGYRVVADGKNVVVEKPDCDTKYVRTSKRKLKTASRWSERRTKKQLKKMGAHEAMQFGIAMLHGL